MGTNFRRFNILALQEMAYDELKMTPIVQRLLLQEFDDVKHA